jgi:protoporphyrinogen oxidase
VNDAPPASRTWAIVGGGLLGLTLALRLRQAGHEVEVFEAAPSLGGLADAWEFGGIRWDRHYHVTLLSDLRLRALLEDLGLEQDMVWKETRTGFFTGGRWHSMSSSVEFLRFPPLNLVEKFRLGATIFLASKRRDWRRLEQIPVDRWLTAWSGRGVFEKIWRPLLRAKLGDSYRDASAAFIWAIIARMYAARQSGLKKEMFGYLQGGYGRLLSVFQERLEASGVRLHPAHPVSAVRRAADGLEITFADGSARRFREVVLTGPSPAAARLAPDLTESERAALEAIRYQGIVCVSLLLRRPLRGFYVTNITDDGLPFTAVIEMTSLVDPETFGGQTLVYLPKYVAPDDPLFAEPDDAIVARFTEGLRAMIPDLLPEEVLAARVSRVRHVFPLSTIGYSSRVPPTATSVPGLHVVNSSHILHGTLNVNETVALAERAARELANLPRA